MKQCKCGSYAFNIYKEDIDQGDLCDVHYWKEKALAQPEQEPVAWAELDTLEWLNSDKRGASAYANTMLSKRKDGLAQTPLYTTPPQRTWVGLTDDEITSIFKTQRMVYNTNGVTFARAIEAKLKEKNTK